MHLLFMCLLSVPLRSARGICPMAGQKIMAHGCVWCGATGAAVTTYALGQRSRHPYCLR